MSNDLTPVNISSALNTSLAVLCSAVLRVHFLSHDNRLRLCNDFIVQFIRDIFILTYDLANCFGH